MRVIFSVTFTSCCCKQNGVKETHTLVDAIQMALPPVMLSMPGGFTLIGTESTAAAHLDSSDDGTVGLLKLSARHARPRERGVVMY